VEIGGCEGEGVVPVLVLVLVRERRANCLCRLSRSPAAVQKAR
jgi:hypothetical protein